MNDFFKAAKKRYDTNKTVVKPIDKTWSLDLLEVTKYDRKKTKQAIDTLSLWWIISVKIDLVFY